MRLKNFVVSFIGILLIMILLEVIASIIPIWFNTNYRMRFDILVIVYLSLRFENPFLPMVILFIELVGIAFSTEHWALGTLAGVLIYILIRQVKGLIRMETKTLLAILTIVAQSLWFLLISFFIYLKSDVINPIGYRLLYFFAECILLSLMAPYIFMLFDKIMRIDHHFEIGE